MKKISKFIFFVGIFSLMTVAQAFSFPITQPVIVTFGNSLEVQTATATLKDYLNDAITIDFNDIHSFSSALVFMRAHSQLIIVGHGSDQGIQTGNGDILSWKSLAAWINELPSTKVDFVACNSSTAVKYINKPSFGFTGTIDAKLGAYWIALNDSPKQAVFIGLIQNILGRIQEILSTKISLSLGTASGYALATKFNYWSSGTWHCILGWCTFIKDVEENIWWVDISQFDASIIVNYIARNGAQALFTYAVTFWSTGEGVTSDLTLIFLTLATIGQQLYNDVGSSVNGVSLSALFYALMMLLIIVVTIVALWTVFSNNGAQRTANGYSDYLIGIGAQYLILPSWNIVADGSGSGSGSGVKNTAFPMNWALAALAASASGPIGVAVAAFLGLMPELAAAIFLVIANALSLIGVTWLGVISV